MNTQPEALRLADWAASYSTTMHNKCADELRRLHADNERLREAGVGYSQQTMDAVVREREELCALNSELLEALKALLARTENQSIYNFMEPQRAKARAAIAKAEGWT